MGSLEELLPLLCSPASGESLSLRDDGQLATPGGEHTYPLIDGVPVLLDPGRSLFNSERVGLWNSPPPQRGAQLRRWLRWLLYVPPTVSRNVGSDENFNELRRSLIALAPTSGGRRRVLVVGGGSEGEGSRNLLDDPNLDVIETDVYLGPRTRIVCDAHDLPFSDGTFAGVVCQAVLEHVLDPWRVVEEIWRVLQPGGYVYSEVPFMQQVHGGAFDFTRFTLLGHRRLWRCFDEIRSGAQGGPGMALIWSVMYFLRSLLPRRLWAVADRIASLGFFWLKYLDGWLVRTPGGLDAASGTFFLGRRRSTPLDDRSIVRGYRGGGPPLD
jgi:SAM-dependent methyltransferase/uncharacterized protein YbaR (Trm112 family)